MAAFTEAGVQMVAKDIAKFAKDLGIADEVVQELGDSTEKLADQSEKTQKKTSKFAKTMGKVGTGMLGAGVAVGGIALALGKMAAPLPGIEKAFVSMAEESGISLDRMREAAQGTVSDFELMQTANVALTGAGEELGKEFGQKLPGLLKIAQSAARATGQDTKFLFESLVTGIKRTSPMLIDNTGLQLKLGEANQKLADQLGKTVAELSGEEKQIALLNATMEAGEKMVRDFGAGQRTAAEDAAAMEASLANAKDQIGLLFLPVLQQATGIVSDLAQKFTDLPQPIKEMGAQVALGGAALLIFAGGAIKAGVAIAGLASTIGVSTAALLGPLGLIAALVAAGVAAAVIAKQKEDEAAAILDTSSSYAEYTLALEDAKVGMHEVSEGTYDLIQAMRDMGEEVDVVALQRADYDIEVIAKRLVIFGKNAEDAAEIFRRDFLPNMTDTQLQVASASDEFYKMGLAMWDNEIAARAFADAVQEDSAVLLAQRKILADTSKDWKTLTIEQEAALKNTGKLTSVQKRLSDQMQDSLRAYGDYTSRQKEAARATEILERSTKSLGDAVRVMQTQFEKAYAVATSGIGEILQLQEGFARAEESYLSELESLRAEKRAAETKAEREAIQERINALKAGREEELQIEREHQAQVLLETALGLAEATGELQEWAAGAKGAMAPAFDTTAEVMAALRAGTLELGGPLGDLVNKYMVPLAGSLDDAAAAAESNEEAMTSMMDNAIVKAQEMAEELGLLEESLEDLPTAAEDPFSEKRFKLQPIIDARDRLEEVKTELGLVGDEASEDGALGAMNKAVTTIAEQSVPELTASLGDVDEALDVLKLKAPEVAGEWDDSWSTLATDILNEWVTHSVIPDLVQGAQDVANAWILAAGQITPLWGQMSAASKTAMDSVVANVNAGIGALDNMVAAVHEVIAAFQELAGIDLGPFQGASPPPVAEWFDSISESMQAVAIPDVQMGSVSAAPTAVMGGGGGGGDTINVKVLDTLSAALVGGMLEDQRRERWDAFAGV